MVMIDKASKFIKPIAAGATLIAVATLSAPAFAQEAKAPAADAKSKPASRWIKVCNEEPKSKKQLCTIAQELLAKTGQYKASVVLREMEGQKRKSLVIGVLPGMLLKPGLSVQIDKGKQNRGAFGICFPNACYAEIVVDDNYVAQMKKGANLSVTTLNQQAQPVRFDLTLSGFTATYDGDPLDLKKVDANKEKLQEILKKRAEEQRLKLLEQKKKEAAQ